MNSLNNTIKNNHKQTLWTEHIFILFVNIYYGKNIKLYFYYVCILFVYIYLYMDLYLYGKKAP